MRNLILIAVLAVLFCAVGIVQPNLLIAQNSVEEDLESDGPGARNRPDRVEGIRDRREDFRDRGQEVNDRGEDYRDRRGERQDRGELDTITYLSIMQDIDFVVSEVTKKLLFIL